MKTTKTTEQTTNDVVYTIYEHTITTTMQGDREECAGWDAGDELSPKLTSLDDAIAQARAYAEKDSVEVDKTRYGIGSMTRPVYTICGWTEDESGDYVTCDEDGTPCDKPLYTLDVLDLHPECKSAWDKAKASYYSFLDYDEDSYGSVTDYAETK